MAFHGKLSARAEADIDSAIESLTKYSSRAASRWHSNLLEKISTLEESPDRYPFAEEAEPLGMLLREMLFGKKPHVYRLLFVLENDLVQILHVRHSARDWLKPPA